METGTSQMDLWIKWSPEAVCFGVQKQYVFEHFALRGFISEITVFYSQCCQWPYMFLYLISHFSLSMIHLLRLPQQTMTPYNQEMTNIIKGHDNCNDNDAGLLARLSFSPTQLPVKKGHSFQCQGGILIRICKPRDVLHRVSRKSKACHQSHVISLVICKEQKSSISIYSWQNIFPDVLPLRNLVDNPRRNH